LSDQLSNKINQLSAAVSNSDLWGNLSLRANILREACPKNLQVLLGLETIVKRIPENYAKAIFAAYLASRYVYKCGFSETPEFSFFGFIQNYMKNE